MNRKCANTGVLFIHNNNRIMSFERKWVKLSCVKQRARFFFLERKTSIVFFSAMQNVDIKQ